MKQNTQYDKKDASSIERFALRLVDKSLRGLIEKGEVAPSLIKDNQVGKGGFGVALEKYYFKIQPGNESRPDFPEAHVELKTTPLKRTGTGLWSKERLVLNIINFMDIVGEKWETSSFLRKNSLLLLVFYLHEKGVAVIDLLVKLAGLWEYPAQDKEIIRQDWNNIVKKIKEGKAHEISEGDTYYLGACTKGANRKSKRQQPFSKILAKQRAFAFKQRYVNYIIRALLERQKFHIADTGRIIKDASELKAKTFDDVVIGRFKPYLGLTTLQIAKKLGIVIKLKAKNYNDIITRGILKVDRSKIEEFEKAEVIVKSIVLEKGGGLKESISFPYFKYKELIKEKDWDNSGLKQMFEKRFFFVVYRKGNKGERTLVKVMFWNMPYNDLDRHVQSVWKKTKKRVIQGKYNELPKISDNPVAHVRPHGRNAKDVCETPDGKTATKKCFWLNAKYIREQIGRI